MQEIGQPFLGQTKRKGREIRPESALMPIGLSA